MTIMIVMLHAAITVCYLLLLLLLLLSLSLLSSIVGNRLSFILFFFLAFRHIFLNNHRRSHYHFDAAAMHSFNKNAQNFFLTFIMIHVSQTATAYWKYMWWWKNCQIVCGTKLKRFHLTFRKIFLKFTFSLWIPHRLILKVKKHTIS